MKFEPHFGCHQAVDKSQNFCPAITKLMDEHLELKPRMENILSQTIQMMAALDTMDQMELKALKAEVESFKNDLDTHSHKEEAFLFDTLANYIGRNSGPIAVMEYEHNTAKTYLNHFLLDDSNDIETFNTLKNGIELLTEHFKKEEVVLFPMAENILSDEEKIRIAENIIR